MNLVLPFVVFTSLKMAGEPQPRADVGTVYADMAVLLREGRAETLKDAYEKATWANPQTRVALLEEQRKAEDAQRAQRARQAQRAGAINVRTSPGTTPSMPKSIRETMEATFDSIHAA